MEEKMTIAMALERKSYAQATLAELNEAIRQSIVIEKGSIPKINFETYLEKKEGLLKEINALKLAIIKANQRCSIDGATLQQWIIIRGDMDEQLKLYKEFLAESPGKKTKGYMGEAIEHVYAIGVHYDGLSKRYDALRKHRMEVNARIQKHNNIVEIDVDFK